MYVYIYICWPIYVYVCIYICTYIYFYFNALLRGTAGDPALGEVDDAYTTNATTRKTERTTGTHIHMFTGFTSSKVPVLTPEGTRSYRFTIHIYMFTCCTSTKVPVLTPDGDAELSVHNLNICLLALPVQKYQYWHLMGTRSYRSTISRSSIEEASRKFKVRKQVCWPMRRIERGRWSL